MTYNPKEKFSWDEGDIVIVKKKTKDLLLTLKQLSLSHKLTQAGANLDDIIGIYQDNDKYYVDFGDWAEEESIKAVKKILGSIDYEMEAPPPKGNWKQVWPNKSRNQGRNLR